MLKLREIRPWAQTWFALELLVAFAVLAAGLAVCPFAWGWYGVNGLLAGLAMSAAAAAIVFGFLVWVGRDARRAQPEVHREHVKEKPLPNGDLRDVVSAPDLPPWMGVGP
jgi:hypothetical protein